MPKVETEFACQCWELAILKIHAPLSLLGNFVCKKRCRDKHSAFGCNYTLLIMTIQGMQSYRIDNDQPPYFAVSFIYFGGSQSLHRSCCVHTAIYTQSRVEVESQPDLLEIGLMAVETQALRIMIMRWVD